jgi:hypothetical protein
MSTTLTIRDVDEETHAELVARAKRAGQSLQEYLRSELAQIAQKPEIETWIARVREHKATYRTGLTTEQILELRNLDRDMDKK